MGRLSEFFRYSADLDHNVEDDFYSYITLEKGCWYKKHKTSLIRARTKEKKELDKLNK